MSEQGSSNERIWNWINVLRGTNGAGVRLDLAACESLATLLEEYHRRGPAPETLPQRIAVETPQSRSLFDMADNLIREMRKQDMWGMRSEYDNWTLRITRNEPTPSKANEPPRCEKCQGWHHPLTSCSSSNGNEHASGR